MNSPREVLYSALRFKTQEAGSSIQRVVKGCIQQGRESQRRRLLLFRNRSYNGGLGGKDTVRTQKPIRGMRIMKQRVFGALAAWALIFGVALTAAAQAQKAAAQNTEDFTIPEGTEFKLQLHTTVNSKISKVGDRIISTLYDPVYVYDEQVLPKGARIDGHIGEVKAAGRRGKGGYMSIVFDSVEMPNGEKMAILGSLTEVFSSETGGDPKVGVEGDLKGGGASLKERAAIIAIPTAGMAATGNVGATIIVGAASAVAAYIIPKGKQAELSAGSLIGMRLDRDVTLTIPVSSQ
jgi:hypothetical protein